MATRRGKRRPLVWSVAQEAAVEGPAAQAVEGGDHGGQLHRKRRSTDQLQRG